jgi:hypothetical protein
MRLSNLLVISMDNMQIILTERFWKILSDLSIIGSKFDVCRNDPILRIKCFLILFTIQISKI